MADRLHTSFRSTGCLLMPRHSPALVEQLAGLINWAGLAFLICWFPFFSTTALAGYARALALKIPRGPPCLSLA